MPSIEETANYEISDNVEDVSWEELCDVFKGAPLGTRNPQRLETAFRNSRHRYFVRLEGKLIGTGRAISDCVSHAVIFDVVVLPEHQGKGVGTLIMRSLIEDAQAEGVNILLYAVPGKEAFYEKLGFRRMTTAMGLFANAEWQLQNGYFCNINAV